MFYNDYLRATVCLASIAAGVTKVERGFGDRDLEAFVAACRANCIGKND